jgi:hypothetical protein
VGHPPMWDICDDEYVPQVRKSNVRCKKFGVPESSKEDA